MNGKMAEHMTLAARREVASLATFPLLTLSPSRLTMDRLAMESSMSC